MPSTLHVVAACLLDEQNRLLLVRKRRTRLLMMPGGKPEAGEAPLETLARELYEELGWCCRPHALQPLGHFSAPAANEAGVTVTAEVFWGRIDQEVRAHAEIEELIRVPLDNAASVPLAPLQKVLMPALLAACSAAD